MKTTVLAIVSLLLTSLGFQTPASAPSQQVKTSLESQEAGQELRDDLRFLWVEAAPESVELYPNFEEKLSSREARKKEGCRTLVSGGLYTKEGRPIGLFVSKKKKLRGEIEHLLYNGIFGVAGKEAFISGSPPQEEMRFAVQSGPILFKDGAPQDLDLESDKEARRVVAAITGEGKVVFLTIYNTESAYLGPLLKDLPKVLVDVEEKTGLDFVAAINLDGGTASAFLTEEVQLAEIAPVGSYFCIK